MAGVSGTEAPAERRCSAEEVMAGTLEAPDETGCAGDERCMRAVSDTRPRPFLPSVRVSTTLPRGRRSSVRLATLGP